MDDRPIYAITVPGEVDLAWAAKMRDDLRAVLGDVTVIVLEHGATLAGPYPPPGRDTLGILNPTAPAQPITREMLEESFRKHVAEPAARNIGELYGYPLVERVDGRPWLDQPMTPRPSSAPSEFYTVAPGDVLASVGGEVVLTEQHTPCAVCEQVAGHDPECPHYRRKIRDNPQA